MRTRSVWTSLAMAVCLFAPALAATPPGLLNYQGVLRDAADSPLDGTYDMTFRFFSAASAGNEILRDVHQAASGNAVTVSGGLFGTALGGGTVSDGSGPGAYTSLAAVFRDHAEVWLSVEVNGELLTPRVRVLAAAYSLNAVHLDGRTSSYFLDTSSTAQVKSGPLDVDASAVPSSIGVDARGTVAGGHFEDADGGSQGYVGYGAMGVYGIGPTVGGYFSDSDQSGFASVGYGDYGIFAVGNAAGGLFQDFNSSATAYVGYGDHGIHAYGNMMGGFLQDADQSGFAYVGYGDYGIQAYGNTMGGLFQDGNASGLARVAYGDTGIQANGTIMGGFFSDADASGWARVGYADTGIEGYGNATGGYFQDVNSSAWAQVGASTYKISGSGTVSFVQNHPERSDQVIVYHAPEASEVAVYTRGSARLSGGLAHIALDPTFAWTANPDVGLTAHLTPRGACPSLHVESLSTGELSVRCDDAAATGLVFDYMVWGLRLGFEELPPVQPKEREARIPSMLEHRDLYAAHPELRAHNALERFKGEEGRSLELGRSAALVSAIGVYDPRIHGPVASMEIEPDPTVPTRRAETEPTVRRLDDVEDAASRSLGPPASQSTELHPVSEPVEVGDVLVVDPGDARALRLGREPADPTIVGIVSGEIEPTGSNAPIALFGTVVCKVDAGYGSIRVGDLLTTSPTPGHAMRAAEARPGTVLGKALESLESGQESIRVLVMLR